MVLKLAAAALLCAAPACAEGFWGSPRVCANPDVLDFVARDVRARDPYATIDARDVRELPAGFGTGDKDCTAATRSVIYHQPPYGRAVPVAGTARYAVRTLPDGFVVTPLP